MGCDKDYEKEKVYIDGKEAGTLSCHSIYNRVNYVTYFIELPNDGEEHKVILM